MTTVLSKALVIKRVTMGEGCQKLRDVIYGRPLKKTELYLGSLISLHDDAKLKLATVTFMRIKKGKLRKHYLQIIILNGPNSGLGLI